MDQENFVGEVALKALIEREGKVLLSRDKASEKWDFPGGRLQKGETPREGLAREIREEIGIAAEIGEPFYTDVGAPTRPGGYPRFFIVYRAALQNPEQPFSLAPGEIEEVRWVRQEELGSVALYGEYQRALEKFFNLSDK